MVKSRHPRQAGRTSCRRRLRPHFRYAAGCACLPNYLVQALQALYRVTCCQRRLARLAPAYFDAGVVLARALDQVERRKQMDLWLPALEKVYGPFTEAERQKYIDDLYALPPLPSPKVQREVDLECARFDLWLASAEMALDASRRHQPHKLPSLGQIARLLSLASDLGRLACGLETRTQLPSDFSLVRSFQENLERAYGSDENSK